MKKILAAASLAVGLTLTACSDATDPSAEQLSPEQAREAASSQQEESGSNETETGTSETGTSETGTSESGETGSGPAESGMSESGTEGATTDGSRGAGITDEALARIEQEFPSLARIVPEEQLRRGAEQVCSAVSSGGVEQAQQAAESIPGLSSGTAQQMVSFLEQNVCTA